MNASTIWNLIAAKQSSSPNRAWKDAGWTLAILTVLFVIGQVIEPSNDHGEYIGLAVAMFVVAVIELGGHTFSEFKNDKVAVQWLTLPATTLEKWTSNFVTSFFLVPFAMWFIITAATLVANAILGLSGWSSFMPVFNPFTAEGWFLLKFYWIIHPILFFGAIYFKKRPILKTLGSLSLFFIALVLYVGFVGDWLWVDHFEALEHLDEGNYSDEEMFFIISEHFKNTAQGLFIDWGTIKFIAHTLFYGYFVFFWGLSYLRLKELEL